MKEGLLDGYKMSCPGRREPPPRSSAVARRRRITVMLGALLWVALNLAPFFPGADGARAQKAGDAAALKLTLEDAISIAMKNNPTIVAAKAQKEAARLAFQRVRESVKQVPDDSITVYDSSMGSVGPEGPVFGARQTYLAKRQAETMNEIADKRYEFTVKSVKFETISSYFGVLRALRLLEVSEQNVKRAQAQLELARSLERAGVVPHKDVLDAESGLSTAEAGFVSAKKGVEVARLSFSKTLGIDLDTKIELAAPSGGGTIRGYGEGRLSDDIRYALEHNFNAFQARKNSELADYELDLAGRYLTENTWTYRESFQKSVAAKEELRS